MNYVKDSPGNNHDHPGKSIGTNQELFPKSSEFFLFYHNLSSCGWTISQPIEDVIFTFFYQTDGSRDNIIKYKISSKECFTVSKDAKTGRWQETLLQLENGILDLDRKGTRW